MQNAGSGLVRKNSVLSGRRTGTFRRTFLPAMTSPAARLTLAGSKGSPDLDRRHDLQFRRFLSRSWFTSMFDRVAKTVPARRCAGAGWRAARGYGGSVGYHDETGLDDEGFLRAHHSAAIRR